MTDQTEQTEQTDNSNDIENENLSESNPNEKTIDTASEEKYLEALPIKRSGGLTVLGILSLISGISQVPSIIAMCFTLADVFTSGNIANYTSVTQILTIISVVSNSGTTIGFIILGIRLIRQNRVRARHIAQLIIILLTIDLLCSLMLTGATIDLAGYLIVTIVLIVLLTYIDPGLSAERKEKREKRNEETREKAEKGILGLDTTGKGFISLDFFNLFWIFVIASFLGDMFETVWHMTVVDFGHYQDRAGLLFGPFSPIYGVGAIIMTILLNRFYKTNIIIIFLVSAVVGGAFEFFVSWFLQFAFGITAWNYTGTFLSIGGRTNGFFMCMWGLLGVFWIKLMLPIMIRLLDLIPWKWRYTITTVCAALMIVDAAMTLIAYDCWYSRLAGLESNTPVMQFFGQYFDNDWMSHRFQTMSIDPNNTTRTQSSSG